MISEVDWRGVRSSHAVGLDGAATDTNRSSQEVKRRKAAKRGQRQRKSARQVR